MRCFKPAMSRAAWIDRIFGRVFYGCSGIAALFESSTNVNQVKNSRKNENKNNLARLLGAIAISVNTVTMLLLFEMPSGSNLDKLKIRVR